MADCAGARMSGQAARAPHNSDSVAAPPWGTLSRGHVTLVARVTGLEPATSGVTGRRSNQLSYTRVEASVYSSRG